MGGVNEFPRVSMEHSGETEKVVIFGIYFGVRFCVRPAKKLGSEGEDSGERR